MLGDSIPLSLMVYAGDVDLAHLQLLDMLTSFGDVSKPLPSTCQRDFLFLFL